MNAINLFIGGKDRPATGNARLRAAQPDLGRGRQHGRRSHRRGCHPRGRRGGRRLPGLVGARPDRAARAARTRRPTSWPAAGQDFTALMMAEIGATAGWAGFNVHAGRRHAARGRRHDHADRRRGHPDRQARQPRHGLPPAGRRRARHRALERAGDPGRARHRHAARLRQHRGAQGLRDQPRRASPDRPVPAPRPGSATASSTSSPTRRRMRRRSSRR